MSQYMVEFELPLYLTEEFISKIPAQRARVNELMTGGKITSYALTADRQKLWVTVTAKAETEVVDILCRLPLTQYMEYEIHELMFFQSVQLVMPPVSMN